MARTYPAKRAKVAKVEDMPTITFGADGVLHRLVGVLHCQVCDEPIQPGDRFIGEDPFTTHARCADAGEALP